MRVSTFACTMSSRPPQGKLLKLAGLVLRGGCRHGFHLLLMIAAADRVRLALPPALAVKEPAASDCEQPGDEGAAAPVAAEAGQSRCGEDVLHHVVGIARLQTAPLAPAGDDRSINVVQPSPGSGTPVTQILQQSRGGSGCEGPLMGVLAQKRCSGRARTGHHVVAGG